MTGQPPVMPPTLSYKSKAEREREERERQERERQERERQERERAEREVQEAQRLERERLAASRAAMAATAATPPGPPALTQTPAPAMETAESRRPPSAPADVAMFEEDGRGLSPLERDGIEMLGAPEEGTADEEVVGEVEEEVPEVRRRPPRPPKSPDTRPIYVGFILVFTGLAQLVWGVLAMWNSPDAASGTWSLLVRWNAFAMGFIASFLGLLAIRGGLWSFRKERFGVVKLGAISASVCIWAWWIPWLFGILALLIVQQARHEYYPFYNPVWDAPAWTRPPESSGEEGPDEEGPDEGTPGGDGPGGEGPLGDVEEGGSQEGDGLDWEGPATGEGRDAFPG